MRYGYPSLSFIQWMMLVAACLCVLSLFVSGEAGLGSGREMSTIASHLVNGYGFLSPYLAPELNVPTTVCAPLYVWLIALVYELLGVETFGARFLLQLINIALHCGTLYLLYQYCLKLLGVRVANTFAVLYTFSPHTLYLTSNIWETNLTTFLLSAILTIATWHLRSLQWRGLLLFGILLGMTALSNPAWTLSYPLICLLPFFGKDSATSLRQVVRTLIPVLLGFAVVVSPWIYRNHVVTHEWIYIRGLAGPELYKGNNPDAQGGHGAGFVDRYLLVNPAEIEQMQALGEQGYDHYTQSEATRFIKENPARYAVLTLQRIVMWWSGDIDAALWYRNYANTYEVPASKRMHFLFCVLLIAAGALVTLFAIPGLRTLWCNRQQASILLVYIGILPIPYYLIIVGFRYQAALMPFVLIAAAITVSRWQRINF